MNANELADELDESVMKLVANDHFFEAQAVEKAQTMLRQQQAEILAGKIMIKGYSKTIDEQQAEIEALKSKLSLWEKIGRQIANNDNQGTS